MCLALPGQILEITGSEPLSRSGRVSFSGVIKTISLALVPEAQVDDYVLVHAGVALNVVDDQTARETLTELEQLLNLPLDGNSEN